MSPRLAFALEAVHAAGVRIMTLYDTESRYEFKLDQSPVTEADLAAERFLREAIEANYPGEAILGEEEGGGSEAKRWVIDPIDGTKSFVSRVPLFATLLSYEVDGEPELGVCYFPALDEMLYAEKGRGAFFQGRPTRVSSENEWGRGIIACGSMNSLRRRGVLDQVEQLAERVTAVRNWTDAYGHALVATGRVQAMIDPIVSRWDVSALSLIVREAGGRFTDFEGRENPSTEAVASHGPWHDDVLAALCV